MQTHGYMIVMKPEVLIESYDRPERVGYYDMLDLRKSFPAFNPKRYRGIFRWGLFPYSSLDVKEIEKFQANCLMFPWWPDVPLGKTDARARYRFREIIGNPSIDEYTSGKSYAVLDNLTDAKELYFLTNDPRRWEIIHVSRAESRVSENTLGYDIGYWDSDHFSLIGDTIVTPCFHGPPREDYFELACTLSMLNEPLLFPSINDSENFRSYYKSKSWAEEEDIVDMGDKFDIIRVDIVLLYQA